MYLIFADRLGLNAVIMLNVLLGKYSIKKIGNESKRLC